MAYGNPRRNKPAAPAAPAAELPTVQQLQDFLRSEAARENPQIASVIASTPGMSLQQVVACMGIVNTHMRELTAKQVIADAQEWGAGKWMS